MDCFLHEANVKILPGNENFENVDPEKLLTKDDLELRAPTWTIKSTKIDFLDKTTTANKFSDGVDNNLDGEKSSDYTTSTPTVTTTATTPTESSVKCLKAAIDQFPQGFIPPKSRKYGTIIFHIALCVYSFFGLAITCDNYFVTSLDRICEEMKLSADVAGATFMAAGSSAPELATVIIGVFLAQDDIGISGVIGSAVFNILFVIALCGLFATSALYLSWWPLCRDCFFYTLSILIMLVAIANENVNWFEGFLLLFTYGIYCIALYYNEALELWVSQYPPFNTLKNRVCPTKLAEDPNRHLEDLNTPRYSTTEENITIDRAEVNRASNGSITADHNVIYYKPKEPRPSEVDPLEMPANADKFNLYRWYAVYPIHYMNQLTMPDCKKEQYRKLYPLTFLISMVWISFYSYIMVWMITVIGNTLNIPDTVMGLTFVAAGVSVPDALSSLAVVKEGYGDMAVSNAVGSNVFDILVCLGLPWFLKTGIISPGTTIKVYSKGLTYSTLSLLSTVVILIFATHWNGWKLDKKFGAVLMVGYFIFIIVASLYELNVFGIMNPPVCDAKY
ncbi:hypothetical protein V9T40_013962 [Parthenolecanium corni]|uniref:Sodium/calcium exchanger membrane region domain-containing protein n=1 Tax=Parthenolecanium corni TaxID=536013 RepID=A0AAN9TFS8_9HEMI